LNTNNGQSLAEFAVITAMMATFIVTAVPKYSDIMEMGKGNKSVEELDKLLIQAKNFYETTASLEGRGRLPGQDKYNMQVGGYSDVISLFNDLDNFTSFTNETIGSKWVSVFGKSNPKAEMPNGSFFYDDTVSAVTNLKGEVICHNCPEGRKKGSEEWYDLFNREELISPYQDGHYIYVVIPGNGSGYNAKSPKICVADAENPKTLHKFIDL
jgi:hypothetical protein|tara:strand:- start:263 stop:898 length:636 start_codon:yes stop_codon:yes gene_type:complete